ncbi:unnamed protein product [Cunninghamella blakesleeana]
MSNSEDTNVIKKYDQLKNRIQQMEQENSNIHTKLVRAQKHVKQLRMERLILLEQLDEYYITHKDRVDSSDSEDSDISGIGSLTSFSRKRKNKRGQFNDRNGKKSGNSKTNENPPVRKKKDPNAPKGPGNVFFLFCRMERGNFKDELPTENLGEVTRLLGQKWKAMSDDEKKKYYDIYDKEQEEYRKAMKSYKEAGGGDAGRIAVSKLNDDTKDDIDEFDVDVDMLVGEQTRDDDDEDDDEDVDEDEDDEDDDESIMDDVSVATTNLSSIIDPLPTTIATPTATTTASTPTNTTTTNITTEYHRDQINDDTESMDINSDPIIEITSPTKTDTEISTQ